MTKLAKHHHPKSLILTYDSGLIEHRRVKNDGSVGSAKPLYQNTINKLFGHLHGHSVLKQFKGIIPENVLYMNNVTETLAWYYPKMIHPLIFNNKKWNDDYALPMLLFKCKGNHLSVFAIKGNKPDSLLYIAPFANITGSGVCMGTASLNTGRHKYFEDVMSEVHNKFFNSKFTHAMEEYYLLGKGKKVFPNKKLITFKNKKATIKSILYG